MPSIIKNLKAREILDSRGEPTVEVELKTDLGIFRASVPSGKSIGKYEAFELRDGEKRYFGKGVLKAVKNINQIIAPKLKGEDVTEQSKIDKILIDLDGTKNKSRLGTNAIVGVSMAVCRAGAAAKNIPLYKYINKTLKLAEVRPRLTLPIPCFNIINGGVHAGNDLDIQEFMIIPARIGYAEGVAGGPQTKSFKENLRVGAEIYHALKDILEEKFGKTATNLGDEGGFSPPLEKTKNALDLIIEAIKRAGYQNKVKIGLDCAASQFFEDKKYILEGKELTSEELLKIYQNLIGEYPISFFEDPFSEEDLGGWQMLSLNSKFLIVGDDLLVTNPERIKRAQELKLCNSLLLKINQIGTISEALTAAKLAKSFGWKIIVSHRSGETIDSFISDFAVGIKADFIKSGAPARGERVAKYNRLLKIEEEIYSRN